ncbi:MAG: hypothetical protein K2X08_06255, partial [Chlamydiales bacterium]|nr:hypothetical protein [Chlamydiales bacterium]
MSCVSELMQNKIFYCFPGFAPVVDLKVREKLAGTSLLVGGILAKLGFYLSFCSILKLDQYAGKWTKEGMRLLFPSCEAPLPSIIKPHAPDPIFLSPNRTSFLENIPIQQVLHSLIPGDYAVFVTKEGGVEINNQRIENLFKKWLNVASDEALTIANCKDLKVHMRYRDLSWEERKKIRIIMWQEFHGALKQRPDQFIQLPFKGYGGETLSIGFVSAKESIAIVPSESVITGEIYLFQNGQVSYLFGNKNYSGADGLLINKKQSNIKKPLNIRLSANTTEN